MFNRSEFVKYSRFFATTKAQKHDVYTQQMSNANDNNVPTNTFSSAANGIAVGRYNLLFLKYIKRNLQ